jgi:Lon protease-like protein
LKVGNVSYNSPGDLPEIIPVFPLPGALLLPRAEMPLNIFEPRYIAMVDAALGGQRVIGMVQPGELTGTGLDRPGLQRIGCAGRITGFEETGDGRYAITLTGITRFHIREEVATATSFRICRVTAAAFAGDFREHEGAATVDRTAVLKTFRAYLEAHNLEADWETVGQASNEMLVNALAMMAPFDPAEKQALLEAPDLRARAETLVAITEMSLARESATGPTLQ